MLVIVIFGNWDPVRGALGAYLFVFLQTIATVLQSLMPGVPTQVFPALPFPLMILTLLLVTLRASPGVNRLLPAGARGGVLKTLRALQSSPPAALGVPVDRG